MSASFPAKYKGHCACCSQAFAEGALVVYKDDELIIATHQNWDKEPCPKCFTVKSVTGECDCDE